MVSASLFVAICARVTLPCRYSGTADSAEFWRAAGGLTLGSRRGFAALALYLIEGAVGNSGF